MGPESQKKERGKTPFFRPKNKRMPGNNQEIVFFSPRFPSWGPDWSADIQARFTGPRLGQRPSPCHFIDQPALGLSKVIKRRPPWGQGSGCLKSSSFGHQCNQL